MIRDSTNSSQPPAEKILDCIRRRVRIGLLILGLKQKLISVEDTIMGQNNQLINVHFEQVAGCYRRPITAFG